MSLKDPSIAIVGGGMGGLKGGDYDTRWLYGYDAWNCPLTPWEPDARAS